MTVSELMQKTCANVVIKDGNDKCEVSPWNIFFEAFKDCVVDTVQAVADCEIEITLKTQLIKKEG